MKNHSANIFLGATHVRELHVAHGSWPGHLWSILPQLFSALLQVVLGFWVGVQTISFFFQSPLYSFMLCSQQLLCSSADVNGVENCVPQCQGNWAEASHCLCRSLVDTSLHVHSHDYWVNALCSDALRFKSRQGSCCKTENAYFVFSAWEHLLLFSIL